VFLASDTLEWDGLRTPTALAAAFGLHAAVASGVGLAVLGFVALGRSIRDRPLATALLPAVLALLATAYALSIPLLTRSSSGTVLFALAVYVLALAASAAAVRLGLKLLEPAQTLGRVGWLAGAITMGAVVVDRTCLVSLYEHAHVTAEGFALVLAATLGAAVANRTSSPRARRCISWTSAVALVWLVAFLGIRPLRRVVEHHLPSVWEQQVYTARWLGRVHATEAILARPSLVSHDIGRERLFRAYDLHRLVTDPRWKAPSGAGASAPSVAKDMKKPLNVVVFFVDALRADVASDPSIMPTVASWMARSTSFSRAYGVGSSTILSLVPMLGCRYDHKETDSPRLLDAAHDLGYSTGLFIPRSAREFHGSYFPMFRFDHEDVRDDYVGKRLALADPLVERTIEWLADRGDAPSLAWTYQYDVHSWGDLDSTYVEAIQRDARFDSASGLDVRYRAAARGVDMAFAKLLAGLERIGQSDRTVVVFLSDHGEALGERQFWIHSTYLWESLLRVPLAVFVPGTAPRRIDTPVSLIDVAPTLASFLPFPTNDCHGEDLLRATSPRRFPILFSALSEGRVARVGLLAPNERKLVVDLSAGNAKLFRVSPELLTEEDVSRDEPALLLHHLDELVGTPLFPK